MYLARVVRMLLAIGALGVPAAPDCLNTNPTGNRVAGVTEEVGCGCR